MHVAGGSERHTPDAQNFATGSKNDPKSIIAEIFDYGYKLGNLTQMGDAST